MFQKNWFTAVILISLLSFQLIYSFLFPAVGSVGGWPSVTAYLPEQLSSADSFLLDKIYPLISPEYRLNADVRGYLAAAYSFSRDHLRDTFSLSRPLYPFLIFLFSIPFRLCAAPSFGIIFGLAILVNFVLISLAVLLFFQLLKNLFSPKVAWLSSILLIFSPFVHTFLVQPSAEMLMALAVVLTAYLLYSYSKTPSILKLISYSLIIGIFMLGKMFFAIAIFIVLLAIYLKRYREGVIFFMVHFIPLSLWYLWVTKIWQLPYLLYDFQYYWTRENNVFDVFHLPLLKIGTILLHAAPYFIAALVYGFLFIPIMFSIIGWRQLPFKSRNLIYFGPIIALFFLSFMLDNYAYRHAFLLFPIILPAAVLGMERVAHCLKKYHYWYAPLFYTIILGLIIFISNINFYQIFNFDYVSQVHWANWPLPAFLKDIFKSVSGRYQ